MPRIPLFLDLKQLARQDPEAAQVGYWFNHAPSGGVDLDGDPQRLTWDEYVAGARQLGAWFPGLPALHRGTNSLYTAFAQAQAPVFETWKQTLGVALVLGVPKPGAARAYGGLTLFAKEPAGIARLGLPFPTPRPQQLVDLSSLELQIVDDAGAPLSAIVSQTVVPSLDFAKEKSLLVLELDRSKLGKGAHLRWSVSAVANDLTHDLSSPAPLPTKSELPADVAGWLAASPMVQVAHPAVAALAKQAAAGATSIQHIVQGSLQLMGKIRRLDWENAPADWQNDAAAMAGTGFGECVANACLFAALLRANGVPCRIVSGISRGNGYPINMHYQNEYWVPGKGWVHVEPQGQVIQSSRAEMVETGVVSPELEAMGGLGYMHYLGVQPLTMMGMEIDENYKPLPKEQRTLQISDGLSVTNSVLSPGVGLHGAE